MKKVTVLMVLTTLTALAGINLLEVASAHDCSVSEGVNQYHSEVLRVNFVSGTDGDDRIDCSRSSAQHIISTYGGDDTVIGTPYGDGIAADDGNDRISGGGGDDFIYGGNGQDRLSGDDGNDRIYGESYDDVVFGGRGDDILYAGSGNDRVLGGPGNDRMFGEEGSDHLIGPPGTDYADGGPDAPGDLEEDVDRCNADTEVECER